jgi:hypothetical protein
VTSSYHPYTASTLVDDRAFSSLKRPYALTPVKFLLLIQIENMSSFNVTAGNGTVTAACHRNARFMSNLSRGAAEGVYWAMAAGIIILAMFAAVVYSNTEKEYRYSPSIHTFQLDESLIEGPGLFGTV